MSNVRSEKKDDVLCVYFNDARIVDEAMIQQIGSELMHTVGYAANKKLLLNFQGVSFMSSGMIGKILLLNEKCKKAEVKLRLCGISDKIMKVFKLMRLNKRLDIQKSEEKALKKF